MDGQLGIESKLELWTDLNRSTSFSQLREGAEPTKVKVRVLYDVDVRALCPLQVVIELN